jgi:hypothetical protein
MNWINEALNFWKAENVKLSPPASLEQIRQVEEIVGYTFPQDFVDLYLRVDGFRDWHTLENLFSVYPLQKIVKEFEANQNSNFVPFCDYLICSHEIVFWKDRQGIFKSYEDEIPICQTFEEAILLINIDSCLIY